MKLQDVFLESGVGRSISFCFLAKVGSGNRKPTNQN